MLTTGIGVSLQGRRRLGRRGWSNRCDLIEEALADCVAWVPRVMGRVVEVGVSSEIPEGQLARAYTSGGRPCVSTIMFSRAYLLHPDADFLLQEAHDEGRSVARSFRGLTFHEVGHLNAHYAVLGMYTDGVDQDTDNRMVSESEFEFGMSSLRSYSLMQMRGNKVENPAFSALGESSDEEWCAEAFTYAHCIGESQLASNYVVLSARNHPSWL